MTSTHSSADFTETGLRRRRSSRHGGFGWVRDLPDERDFFYSAPLGRIGPLPEKVDLRPGCPAVYDQGQLGSCTANGIGAAVEFDQIKQGVKTFVPSRLFIYYNERAIEGHVSQDSGAQIRDGVKVVSKLGAPPETAWPYAIDKFAHKPPQAAYAEGKKDLVTRYERVPQSLTQFQGCLADGYPFVFGFTVYESFESDQVAKTGVVPMPKPGEAILGGHCVVAVGYDNAKRQMIIRNSWGVNWGLAGYCLMPYEYLINPQLSSDFWTLRAVKEKP
jgi:C1A family cysteine protease